MKKHPWITAAFGAALALLLAAVLIYSRQIIQQQAMDDAVKSLQQVMERTDRHLHQIEAAADSLIPKIEQMRASEGLPFIYTFFKKKEISKSLSSRSSKALEEADRLRQHIQSS